MGFIVCLHTNVVVVREKSIFLVGLRIVPVSERFFEQTILQKRRRPSVFWFASMLFLLMFSVSKLSFV